MCMDNVRSMDSATLTKKSRLGLYLPLSIRDIPPCCLYLSSYTRSKLLCGRRHIPTRISLIHTHTFKLSGTLRVFHLATRVLGYHI